jgi:signal transduction histidine kinase/CheY-like chemotaxis protein
MIRVNEDYQKGNLNSRVSYISKNEFGELAASFNRLAETNQAELRSREMVRRVTDAMLQEEELHSFCHSLIIRLLEVTNSQIGSIYLLNNRKTDFEHFESIGLNPEKSSTFSAITFGGEFGMALTSRQIQVIRDIPVDTPMLFSAVAGDFRPREIISIPIPSANEVVAMMSLASVNAYSSEAIRIINDTYIALVSRFNSVLAHQKILDFTEKLETQNRELDERSRELAIQGNELTEQNLELEMQKQQLDEANRLKSSFLSNMSHELRTPLNSVIALSGVLYRRLRLTIPEEEYKYLEIIERNGKNLLSLINDILDLSRIEAGHEEVTFGNFSIYDVVDEVVSMIDVQARDKNIELVNKVSRELHLLRSDYVKCRHILQNIISNAVKFTEKGKVEINAVEVGDEMLISIADTGIGISEGDLPYIFDEFRQADEGSSRKFGGSGLGLAIAKKFTNLLQGEISVESKPGQGTTFTLRLPLSPETDKLKDEDSNVSLGHYVPRNGGSETNVSGKGKTILVVEDSEPAIIQIREILSEQGFSVSVAKNGREAMEQIGQFRPNAMILDLMMPEVDGFQVLGMIRENHETSTIPVLILTAKHITKEELKFLKGNNIHQFIQKGDIGRLELLATIDEMVNPTTPGLSKPKPRQSRKSGTGKPVVLIVEDNPDNMKTVKALLPGDHTILEAVDGTEAVEMAIKYKPDLILMDLSLPVMDGFSAFKKIRMVEALKDVPIIAVTARAMKGSREEILESGFDDYISKPIDESLFKRVVRYYLHGEGGAGARSASNNISTG